MSFATSTVAYVLAGKSLWEYTPTTDSWTRKSDFPGNVRQNPFAFFVNGKGYVGTGYSYNAGAESNYADVWEYNPSSNTWQQKANFPGGARRETGSFVIGSKAYVGFGTTSSTINGLQKDFWEYTAESDQWIKKNNPINQAGADFAAGFTLNGKGYFTFVYTYVANASGTGGGSQNVGTLEYNPDKNEWQYKRNVPSTSAFYLKGIGFTANNRFYVVGRDYLLLEFTP